MSGEVQERDVLATWHFVARKYVEPNLQLTLLVRAVICAAKSLKVPQSVVVREIARAWDDTAALLQKVG